MRLSLVVASCLILLSCPPGFAQDTVGHLKFVTESTASLPPMTPGDELVDDATWVSTEVNSAEPTWTQRIARLTQGRTQLEGGYSYLRGSTGGGTWTQHAVPDLLLRFGLTQRLELRLGWPGYVSGNAEDPALASGFTGTLDPNVGFLYDLWSQQGWLPQTAVLAAVPISLEGNPFALSSLQPLAELMYAWETSDHAAFTGRSGLALFDTLGDNYIQYQQSLSFDVILTQRLGAFASWDMLSDHGSWNDTTQHMGGGGLSLLLTERLLISWRSAVGLNTAAPDFLNDLRFAYRF